ncbi:MAG: hypothetical protein AMXMBFR7_51010 [Planctomycetota bacterium]
MNPQKHILALDLGHRTGWVLFRDGTLRPGEWDLSHYSKTEPGRRFQDFFHRLMAIHEEFRLTDIYFEEVHGHFGNVTPAHVYAGYKTLLQFFCAENGIECVGVPVQTIKRHATGSGRASKAEVITAMRKEFNPIPIESDNVADAFALLSYVLAESGISPT